MASFVTRHGLKPQTSVGEVLLTGVDTLDLGVYVRWDNQWEFHEARLDTWKQRAAGTNGVLIESDLLPIGSAVMLPGGKPPMYRYHLQLPEFHLFLARGDTYHASPNVYVSLNAETLWRLGHAEAVSLVWGLLEDLGGTVDRMQPSRVDLCVDLHLPGGLTLDDLRQHRVSRSRATKLHETGERLESYYVGKAASPIIARIYHKGLEIEHSHKQWFLPLWKRTDGTDVWRVEFQFRRQALKEFGINDMSVLRERMAGLWQLVTTRWLSFRCHDDARATRRTALPWWQTVADCAERFGVPMEIDRFESPPSDSAEWHEKHIAGCLSSFAAITNLDSLVAALESLCQRLTDQVNPDEFRDSIALKAIKLGKHPHPESMKADSASSPSQPGAPS